MGSRIRNSDSTYDTLQHVKLHSRYGVRDAAKVWLKPIEAHRACARSDCRLPHPLDYFGKREQPQRTKVAEFITKVLLPAGIYRDRQRNLRSPTSDFDFSRGPARPRGAGLRFEGLEA
jgi:hypothetical protein